MRMLRRLLPYFRPHFRSGWMLGVLLALSSGITVITPFLYKELVDTGIMMRDSAVIVRTVAMIAGSMVALELLFLAQTRITLRIRESVFVAMKEAVYARLMSLPPSYYAQQHKGRLLSRLLSDVGALQQLFLDRIVYFVKDLLIGTLILAIMFAIQWRMVLTASLFLPLLIGIYYLFRQGILALSRKVQEQQEQLTERWQEDLSVVSALQSFSGLKARMRETLGLMSGAEKARTKLDAKYAVASASTTLINLVGITVIWGMGAFEVLAGRITIGVLIAVSFYLNYIIKLFFSAYYTVMDVQRSVPSAERVFEIWDAQSAIQERADAVSRDFGQAEIRFERVSFRYQPDQALLEDVNLALQPGDIVGVIGGSGQGKTTFANLLQRWIDPMEGKITIGGVDVREISLEALRRTIAVIPQEDMLIDQSLRDNIMFYRQNIAESQFIQACEQARVDDYAKLLPEGYETRIGERGAKLSGGQRKRLAIARALLEQPYILIMDEATAMLDEETERDILETVTTLAANRIVLIITHKTSNLKHVNRVIRIHEGEVAPVTARRSGEAPASP